MCYFKLVKKPRYPRVILGFMVCAGLMLPAAARPKKSAYDKERDQRIRQNRKVLEQEARQERWQELKTERRLSVEELRSELRNEQLPSTHPKQWYAKHVMGRYAVLDGRPAPLVPIRGQVERVIDTNTIAVAIGFTPALPHVRQPPVIVVLQAKRVVRAGDTFALPNAVRAGSRDYPWRDNSTIPVKVYKETTGLTYKEYRTFVQNGYAFPEQ